jgi:hypothetical protein
VPRSIEIPLKKRIVHELNREVVAHLDAQAEEGSPLYPDSTLTRIELDCGSRLDDPSIEMPDRMCEHRHHDSEADEKGQSANP